MHRYHMKIRLLVTLCVALCACDGGPTIPSSNPTIRGVISGPGDLGSVLVTADNDSTSCNIAVRAQVQTGRAHILHRSGGGGSVSDLKAGVVVSVWTTGLVLDTCPGIVTATTIVIEDTV